VPPVSPAAIAPFRGSAHEVLGALAGSTRRRQKRLSLNAVIGAEAPNRLAHMRSTRRESRKRARDSCASSEGAIRSGRNGRHAMRSPLPMCNEYRDAARAGLVMTRFKRPKRPAPWRSTRDGVARHIVPL